MKQINKGMIVVAVLITSIVFSSCGPGQMFGPTFTPAPTITLTPTFTPTPTFTHTPTFTPSPTFTPTPEPLSIDEVNASVAKIVSDKGGVQEFVRCNLDAAVWGNYDIKVSVASGYTKDATAYFFAIDNGIFSEGILSQYQGSPAFTEGSGVVEIDDQKMAFDLGIPFFISGVTYDGKSAINFTVNLNPEATVEDARMGIETKSESFFSITIKPFTPSSDAQKLTFDLGDGKLEKGMYLSILNQISGTNNFCLLSNQIDLGSLK